MDRALASGASDASPNLAESTVKRQFSAGGLVFKKESDKTLWLLIQPKGDDEFHAKIRWQLPKGWIDEGETSQQAAIREVKEEGGVKAKIIAKIDSIQWFFKDIYEGNGKLTLKTVTFFLMEWQKDTKEGPDKETAEVVWLPYEKAHKKLTFKNEKTILEKGKKILEEGKNQEKLF